MVIISIMALLMNLASAGQEAPASPDATGAVSSVPLFARLSSGGPALRAYDAPITVDVSLHRFFFTFHKHLEGNVRYQAPDHVTFTLERVPEQYQHLFTELGTPITWMRLYALQVDSHSVVDGVSTYTLHGVPRQPSDVEQIVIKTCDDPNAPIHAQWVLHDGWTVTSTIDEKNDDNYLVPKHEMAVIVGHGYEIHSEMNYGDYNMDTD